MNTLKNAADIIKNILGNRNNLLILALIGVLVLILAMPSGESKEETSYTAKKESENEPDGKPPRILCVICGLSSAAYRREDGVYVVPVTALRE